MWLGIPWISTKFVEESQHLRIKVAAKTVILETRQSPEDGWGLNIRRQQLNLRCVINY